MKVHISWLALPLTTALAACSGEYTDPSTGETTDWEFPDDSSTKDEKQKAYDALEAALRVNVDVLALPGISDTTRDLCLRNISEIAKAKMDLAEDLPTSVTGYIGGEIAG